MPRRNVAKKVVEGFASRIYSILTSTNETCQRSP